MKNSRSIVEYILNSDKSDSPITGEDIFIKYAELLCRDTSILKMTLKEDGIEDLESARSFFDDKQINAALIKSASSFIKEYSHQLESNVNFRERLNDIIQNNIEISSSELLTEIFEQCPSLLPKIRHDMKLQDVIKLISDSKAYDSSGQTKTSAGNVKNMEQSEQNPEKQKSFSEHSTCMQVLRQSLLDRIRGQNDQMLSFVRSFFRDSVLNNSENRPMSAFLFTGPQNVGKVMTAVTAAASLNKPYLVITDSGMKSETRLSGISSTNNPSEILHFVNENPDGFLIFENLDDIKNQDILLILISALNSGQIKIKNEKPTSFRRNTIIVTTCLGTNLYKDNYGNLSNTSKRVILDEMINEISNRSDLFKALLQTGINREYTIKMMKQIDITCAILNEFESFNVLLFNHLSIHHMVQIVEDDIKEAAEQIQKEYGITADYEDKIPNLLLFHSENAFEDPGALSHTKEYLKDELVEIIGISEDKADLMTGTDHIHFEIEPESLKENEIIRDLFHTSTASKIAIMCNESEKEYFRFGNKQIKSLFAETQSEMVNLLKEDPDLVLIDLKFGLTDQGKKGISLDDYNSEGIQTFNAVNQFAIEHPIVIIDPDNTMSESDRNSFLSNGAYAVLSLNDSSKKLIQNQINQYLEFLHIEKTGREFARKGLKLNYNSAQIKKGNTLIVQFHDLTLKKTVTNEHSISFEERPTIKFSDVIGAENAKDELAYFIQYLSNPRKFIREGGKPARGVLLYGPPGTGKTMLAKAMAGESNVSFFQTNAAAFLNKYVGGTEEKIRSLFDEAKRAAPSIIFIDEIDAIGRERTGDVPHIESALTELLKQMDGFSTSVLNPVFVLAATNFSIGEKQSRTVLDPALVRRFDNQIYVDLPNEAERKKYLTVMTKKKGFLKISSATLNNISARTPGISLAILENIIDLAYRNAKKKNRTPDDDDLMNAFDEYRYGEKKEWNEDAVRRTAFHEAGHAYVSYTGGSVPSFITIVSRGDYGGYTASSGTEDTPTLSKDFIIKRIRTCLAGRAAEQVFFGREDSLNTGASGDLRHATDLALNMILSYGMTDGQMVSLPYENIANSEYGMKCIDTANNILNEQMKETLTIVENGRKKIELLANKLLEKNQLTQEEIELILK